VSGIVASGAAKHSKPGLEYELNRVRVRLSSGALMLARIQCFGEIRFARRDA